MQAARSQPFDVTDPESPIALKEYSLIHNMNPLNNLGYILSLYLRCIGLSGELDCVMDPCPPDQHESTLETQEAMLGSMLCCLYDKRDREPSKKP